MYILKGIVAALLGLAGSQAAIAQGADPGPLRLAEEPPAISADTLRYESRQGEISLRVPRSERPPPLVIALSGADFGRDARRYPTQWLPNLLFDNGYALASVTTSPPRQIRAGGVLDESIAAIAKLVAEAEEHGYDASRVILLGQGAGGQLAALLGTDLDLLARAGLPPGAVRAVLIINGDAFDLSDRIAASPAFRRSQYERAFGPDPEIHRGLSPAAHVASPNAPVFLLYATEGLSDFAAQAATFETMLRRSGTAAVLEIVPQSLGGTASMIGAPQNPQSAVLVERLDRAIGSTGAN
jgi:acetyl esterase/lipase